MSQNTTNKTPSRVTKSIRLRPEEAAELAHLGGEYCLLGGGPHASVGAGWYGAVSRV